MAYPLSRAPRRPGLFVWCLAAGFFYPQAAHAYLDPGTGNALVYILVSLLGTAVFLVKSLGYRLLGLARKDGGRAADNHADNGILLFSEGKTYWLTFKPVIEALLAKEQPFTYLSMDIDDPALTIESPLMYSRYLGKGSAAFARMGRYRARVMIATTPNIGTPGYPMPRPAQVECLAHIFHGIGDVAFYNKGSLDAYDAALLGGDFMLPNIRVLEKQRGLPEKTCVSLGLPYFDELAKNIQKKEGQSSPACLLIAPSWGEKSFVTQYGPESICTLAKAGYRIIYRPHPHSLQAEPAVVENVRQACKHYPNVEVDTELNGTTSMQQADLLISDKSNIRFDFAFLYEKPVLSIDIPAQELHMYEAADLERIWDDEAAARIGGILRPEEFALIAERVDEALHMPQGSLAALKAETVANIGTSGEAIAAWAIERCAQPHTGA